MERERKKELKNAGIVKRCWDRKKCWNAGMLEMLEWKERGRKN
jgi:hypothetical protein